MTSASLSEDKQSQLYHFYNSDSRQSRRQSQRIIRNLLERCAYRGLAGFREAIALQEGSDSFGF